MSSKLTWKRPLVSARALPASTRNWAARTLAPNAIHTPLHTIERYLDRVAAIRDEKHRLLAAMTVALFHVIFNLTGTAIWWPLRVIPLRIATWYGRLAGQHIRYAFLFLIGVFLIVPLVAVFLAYRAYMSEREKHERRGQDGRERGALQLDGEARRALRGAPCAANMQQPTGAG